MSGRTEADPPAKPRAGPVISVRRPTTTRWPASRGISGVPPSAGAMPRQSPPSPLAARKFWRHTTICASAPARKAIPWRLGLLTRRRSPVTRHCSNRPRPSAPGRTTSPPCWQNAAVSGAGISTPSRISIHGRDATGARPRCATCIGSNGRLNRGRNNNLGRSCGKASGLWRTIMPRWTGVPKRWSGPRTTVPSRNPAATTADAGAPATDAETAKPDWVEPYEALRRDWNSLIERVQQTGETIFYAKGYADMMPRMQALADNRDIAAETRAPMIRALENHQRDLSARKYVADYLDAAERHMGNFAGLQSAAESPDIPIAEVSDYPDWRQEAERLAAAGEAILSDKEAYGVHLDHILIGDTRLKWALSDLRETIRRDSATLRENAVTEPPGAAFPGANARGARARSPKQGPRVPPASIGRLPRIGGRAQSSTEGVRRLSRARVQTLHHVRGRPPPRRPRHT